MSPDGAQPGPVPAGSDPPDALGYAQALDELETILAELETGEVDIDRLSEQVARAAELLDLCRGRLDQAQLEVIRIVAELDADGPAPDSPT